MMSFLKLRSEKKTVGFVLTMSAVVAVVALNHFGARILAADVLPGEVEDYVAEESSESIGKIPGTFRDPKDGEAASIIARIQRARDALYPARASLTLTAAELGAMTEGSPREQTLVMTARSPEDWSLRHARDARTNVLQRSNRIEARAGWDTDGVATRLETDAGPLGLSDTLLREEFVIGIDEARGLARFRAKARDERFLAGTFDVEIERGLLVRSDVVLAPPYVGREGMIRVTQVLDTYEPLDSVDPSAEVAKNDVKPREDDAESTAVIVETPPSLSLLAFGDE